MEKEFKIVEIPVYGWFGVKKIEYYVADFNEVSPWGIARLIGPFNEKFDAEMRKAKLNAEIFLKRTDNNYFKLIKRIRKILNYYDKNVLVVLKPETINDAACQHRRISFSKSFKKVEFPINEYSNAFTNSELQDRIIKPMLAHLNKKIDDEKLKPFLLTPRQIFENYKKAHGINTDSIFLFGMKAEDILKCIEFYERKNSKMKREDAIDKLMKLIPDVTRTIANNFITALEDLGLLQFEEEKEVIIELTSGGRFTENRLRSELEALGYRLTKIGG